MIGDFCRAVKCLSVNKNLINVIGILTHIYNIYNHSLQEYEIGREIQDRRWSVIQLNFIKDLIRRNRNSIMRMVYLAG